jgi:alcohol dehydrogenase
MRALFYETFQGPMRVAQVPDPQTPPDGVLIRVKASGICRSDWHGWMGHDPDVRLPHVPGHEFSGIVEEAGPNVCHWSAGDRVTVPFAVGCGKCEQCAQGNQHICDRYFQPGFTAWGSFAEFVAIPYADANLVRLPEVLDYTESASLGCRFVTSFRAVVNQARVSAGEWVAVHGCGGVGLSAVMIAHALGAKVLGIDVRPEALDLARTIGASQVLNANSHQPIVQAIMDITSGGAHVSIDALGSKDTCRASIECLRKRGRHIQVGLMLADYRDALVPMNQVIAKELEILGSHGMPAHDYPAVFEMIGAGKLSPKRLLGKTITLDEAASELAGLSHFNSLGTTVITSF